MEPLKSGGYLGSGGSETRGQRVLRRNEKMEDRVAAIKTRVNENSKRLVAEMDRNVRFNKGNIDIELRKMVFLRLRPDLYQSEAQIDREFSDQAREEARRALEPDRPPPRLRASAQNIESPEALTSGGSNPLSPEVQSSGEEFGEEEVETNAPLKLAQNLIRLSDSSPGIRKELVEHGFDVEKIEEMAINSAKQNILGSAEQLNKTVQEKQIGAFEKLVKFAITSGQINSALRDMGFEVETLGPIASTSRPEKLTADDLAVITEAVLLSGGKSIAP